MIVFILIARDSGAHQSGIFSLATSYLLLFSSLSWGFDELLIRQVARNRQLAKNYFYSFMLIRFLFSVGLFLILLFIVFVIMDYSQATITPILIMSLCLFTDGVTSTSQSVLSAFGNYHIYFGASILNSLVRLVGVFMFMMYIRDISFLSFTWLLSSFLSAILLVNTVSRQLAGMPMQKKTLFSEELKHQFRTSILFIGIGFLSTLEYQVDAIILSGFASEEQVGWYSAVTTVLFSLTLFSQAYRLAVYPLMADYERNDPNKLKQLYTRSIDLLFAFSLPMAVGITFLAPRMITLIYGEAFLPAVVPLQIIIWSLIFIFLNVPNSRMLLVSENQRQNFLMLSISTGINVILNFILIPILDVNGVAVSRLASTITFFVLGLTFILRHQNIKFASIFVFLRKTLFAILLMVVVLWVFRSASISVLIATGIISYSLGILIFRASDFHKIRKAYRAS